MIVHTLAAWSETVTTDRAQRVGALVQRELAECLRSEVDDPRVGRVSITEVTVTRDLSLATVYVTQVGNVDDAERSLEGLNRAAGYLRRLLSRRLAMRTVPALRFRYDTSVERGAELSKLIDEVTGARET